MPYYKFFLKIKASSKYNVSFEEFYGFREFVFQLCVAYIFGSLDHLTKKLL
jgi:hypothetical protein